MLDLVAPRVFVTKEDGFRPERYEWTAELIAQMLRMHVGRTIEIT
jgi:hypothetical protein